MYSPANAYDKETLVHIGVCALMFEKPGAPLLGHRIAYCDYYLSHRYGTEDHRVPLSFREVENDGLNVNMWLRTAALYVSSNRKDLKDDIERSISVVQPMLRSFIEDT